jgi:pyrimidine 5'-nucleotidase
MHHRIVQFMVENLNMDKEQAVTLSNEYYLAYGLAVAGLHRFHGVDLQTFCRFVNECDYTQLKPDVALTATLQHLKDEGHELWIMTNADMPHARNVLEGLRITDFFQDAESGELRGFDCFMQWGESEPKMQNKPMRGAYEALHRMMDPSVQHSDVAMIDDAFANLEEPHRMGWKTIWISHGRDLPAGATFQPDVIVTTVKGLPEVAFA